MRMPRLEIAEYIKNKLVTAINDTTIPVSMLQGTPPPGSFVIYDIDVTPENPINACTKMAEVYITINVSGQKNRDTLFLMNKVESIFDDGVNVKGIIDGISEPAKRWFIERLYQQHTTTVGNLFVAGVARPTGLVTATTRIYEYKG